MSQHNKPFSITEYSRMADELQVMADSIRSRPEMNHHFAERLALLAAQMRDDLVREHPEVAASRRAAPSA